MLSPCLSRRAVYAGWSIVRRKRRLRGCLGLIVRQRPIRSEMSAMIGALRAGGPRTAPEAPPRWNCKCAGPSRRPGTRDRGSARTTRVGPYVRARNRAKSRIEHTFDLYHPAAQASGKPPRPGIALGVYAQAATFGPVTWLGTSSTTVARRRRDPPIGPFAVGVRNLPRNSAA